MSYSPKTSDNRGRVAVTETLSAAAGRAYAQAVHLIRTGDISIGMRRLNEALVCDPGHMPSRLLLGRVLLHLAQADEALTVFTFVLRKKPHCESALLGQSIAYARLGRRDEALETVRHLVRIAPDSWRGFNSLADLTPIEGERLEALAASQAILSRKLCSDRNPGLIEAAAKAWITLRRPDLAGCLLDARSGEIPDAATAHDLRARAAYFAGDYASAFASKVKSLHALTPDHIPAVPIQMKLETGRAENALKSLTFLLRESGLIPVPMAGTLLGLYRNGRLLDQDRDVDIGLIPSPGCRADPVDLVREHPGLLLERHARRGDRYLPVLWDGISIDLFRLDRAGEYFSFGFSDRPGDVQWRIPVFQSGPEDERGLSSLSPDTASACLRALYGPAWRVPDPYFASVVQSPALWNVALHVRAYYAAHRARAALLQADPVKARALLARAPLPIPLDQARHPDLWTAGDASRTPLQPYTS